MEVTGIAGDSCPDGRSVCYLPQGAIATACPDSLEGMDAAQSTLWRIERLKAAIAKLDDGNLTAFGKRMGYSDGSYIGQMLRGTRPITEKFVRKVEEDNRLPRWFDPDVDHEGPEYQLLIELLSRHIPGHVLQTFLDAVRHYPSKRASA